MSYHIDASTGDLVIDSFQNGTGSDPYSGLTDVKAVNVSTISGEASVGFSTASVTSTSYSNITLTSAGVSNTYTTTGTPFLENGQAIYVSSSTITGLTAATAIVYYITGLSYGGGTSEFSLTTVYGGSSGISTGNTGSAVFSTYNISIVNFFQKSRANNFAIDQLGQVWSDLFLTTGGSGVASTSSWTYMGNRSNSGNVPIATANGNGIVIFTTVHDSTGGTGISALLDEWLFAFRNSAIDYAQVTAASSNTSPTWVYSWQPSTGTIGTPTTSGYLQTNATVAGSHHAIVTPDARANYCDANYIGNFYQNIPLLGSNYTGFNPQSNATYTFQNYTAILPPDDIAQCMAFVNQSLLIGGIKNIVYPWDLNPSDNTYSVPLILLPERGIASIVSMGNNGYIFAGNRGNIYITNGSQSSFFKKVPDHVSNSIEPIFQWGAGTSTTIGVSPQAAAYNKNRLYFGVSGNYQNGGNILNCGGIWCIDLNSNAIYQSQQLSYGTWNGYASAIYTEATVTEQNVGFGLLVGWSDGLIPKLGIDVDTKNPYVNGQSWITSDMIPVGTLLRLNTPTQVELKLSQPLVSGESIQLNVGSYLDTSYASFVSSGTMSYSTNPLISNISWNSDASKGFPIQGLQWLLVQAVMTSTLTNPSYNRLKELRVIGSSVKQTGYYGTQ